MDTQIESPPAAANESPKAELLGIDLDRVGYYCDLLWCNRRFLVSIVAIGLALSVAAAFLIPVKYESTAVLMPPGGAQGQSMQMLAAVAGGGGAAGALGSSLTDLLGEKSTGQLVVRALGAEKLENRIIQRFDLMSVYGKRKLKDAREKLDNRSDIQEDLKSGVITVTVRDRNAKRAADMANAFPEELNRLLVEVSVQSAREQRELLKGPMEQARRELEIASQEFSKFSSKTSTLDPQMQGKAMIDAAAALQGQLIATEAEIKGLERIYTPQHEALQQAQARAAELRRQLQQLGGAPDKAAANPASNGGSSNELYPPIRRLPLLGVTYMDLYGRMRVQAALYDILTQEYELTRVSEGNPMPKVDVLDPATVSEEIVFPPRVPMMLVGVVLSLCAGISWVLLIAAVEQLDPQDPRREFLARVTSRIESTRLGRLTGRVVRRFSVRRPHMIVLDQMQ